MSSVFEIRILDIGPFITTKQKIAASLVSRFIFDPAPWERHCANYTIAPIHTKQIPQIVLSPSIWHQRMWLFPPENDLDLIKEYI